MNQPYHPQKASIKSILSLCLISTAFSQAMPAHAQITPDNTLGAEASQLKQNLIINGAVSDEIEGGATRGSNLFHSFSEFNIENGQRVYFANPTGIENILTRVTGGNASNIFGTLGVAGAANLFLINPNGILFGQNARLDVQGSFVGTTANGVQFGNQGIFSATNPQAPPLLTVNPSALFFNQINQGAGIQNNSIARAGTDPAGFNASGLRVADGKSLLLVGGNVSMDGGELNAYGGRVELGGLAAPGNVNLFFNEDNLSLKFPLDVTRADVSLTNQAFVYVEAAGGGDIAINARNINILRGSQLNAGIAEGLGKPEATAGDITLNATGEIKVADSGSRIRNLVREDSKGNGGNITIDAGSFSLSDDARLSASTYGQGNAGNVTVGAKDAISLAGNAYIFSTVEAGGVGKGGNIDINAATLSLTDGAQLLTITRGASDTQPAGRGDAGNVNVLVTGAVNIAGEKNDFPSGIRSNVETGTVGNGGNIFIDSGSFSLSDGAKLNASTSGVGNAGNVTVGAKDAISLANGDIFSTVEAGGVGKGGNIDINAAILSLTDGAQLLTATREASATQPAGRGDAGNVNVLVTGAVDIAGEKNDFKSGIRSNVETGTVGNGGNIFIDSGSFSLSDGAQLEASTAGQGNAGNVTVGAKDTVSLAGGDIFSDVEMGGVGNSGGINIRGSSLSLTDDAKLSASILGQGNAGNVIILAKDKLSFSGTNSGVLSVVGPLGIGNGANINIRTRSLSLQDGALIATSTLGKGNAGNIQINADDSVFVSNGSVIVPATFGQGNAGSITIEAGNTISFDGVGSNNISSGAYSVVGPFAIPSPEFTGKRSGGDITITAQRVSLTNGAELEASTYGQGNAGNVTVGAKNAVDLAGNAYILSTVSAGGVGKGGNIDINAATLSLTDGAQLLTITRGASDTQPAGRGNAGNVNVLVTGAVDIAGEKNGFPSGIRSNVEMGTVGNGGNIFIDSGSLSLSDSAELSASTSGEGNAGNVTVGAKDAISLANADIFSAVQAGGVGQGGNIDINAATLSLTDGAQLLTATRGASDTQPAGRGNAGNVNVLVTGAVDIAGEKNDFPSGIRSNVERGTVGNGGNIFIDSGSLSLSDSAELSASTSGEGNAGNVTVGAKDAISLANADIFSTVEAGGVGKGGNININATTLSVTDSAQLLTATLRASANQPAGQGDAGNVNVWVTGAVDIAGEKNGFTSAIFSSVDTGTVGNGGNITIDSADFSLRNGAQLVASTYGQGNAGNVTVRAKDAITVSGTSQETGFSSALFTFADSTSTGEGGDITVNTNIFSVSDGALLDARTINNQKGGDITVNASVFEALNGGQLTTTTSSNGRAGKITVNATDKVIISDIDPSYSDRITNFPDNVVNIGANSGLFVSSTGSGITGDIEINSPKITLDNQGKLNAESASGNGGNINVNSDLLLLRRGAQISTNAGTEELGGDGGDININSKFIIAVPEENSDISANAFTGTGGNIQINSQGIFGIESRPKLTEKSDITASSELGVSGVTNINTPDNSSIQNSFTGLSPNVIDTNALIANSCISRSTKRQENSFHITGSGALRYTPGDVLTSAYTTGDVRSVEPTPRPWKKGDPIIEPQGLYRLPNGQLILSRSC
ncbi:MAG: filamentous hemagglutinin N-terminal domain-containing protein [Nostoc sp. DedQUE05]|uniref:beta strand repeat-containing protein n=1 Tax=Nostoc sp. DedQUE05 TaxID=3075391 RepID=UPI002AD1EB29|nr:filamentous hemagglutinin N-terminal domain-containing protein [Nostoc sp. DedQUE05]MDZ8095905.1 filamentous hemagglutinin N-terminal domain-containing protein [Nostoc sp. DedQUE05]